MTTYRCDRCGELATTFSMHYCTWSFLVWCPDSDPASAEGHEVRSVSHRDAAQFWAELYGRSSMHMHVRVTKQDGDDHAPKWFEVTGELATTYHAVECDPPPDRG
jgi:hypothetical protein